MLLPATSSLAPQPLPPPLSQTTRLLHALGLSRSGRAAESSAICDEICTEMPADSDVLGLLNMVCSSLRRMHVLVPVLEALHAADPSDHQLLEDLFGLYVRCYSPLVKLQQVALRLHKLVPADERYLLWAATALLLQASDAAAAAGQGGAARAGPLLQLAESLASKCASRPGGLRNQEAVRLLLEIQLRQGKREAALATLASPELGGRFRMPADRLRPPPGSRRMLAIWPPLPRPVTRCWVFSRRTSTPSWGLSMLPWDARAFPRHLPRSPPRTHSRGRPTLSLAPRPTSSPWRRPRGPRCSPWVPHSLTHHRHRRSWMRPAWSSPSGGMPRPPGADAAAAGAAAGKGLLQAARHCRGGPGPALWATCIFLRSPPRPL